MAAGGQKGKVLRICVGGKHPSEDLAASSSKIVLVWAEGLEPLSPLTSETMKDALRTEASFKSPSGWLPQKA